MAQTAPNHPKFVRWALMLGIVIILNIFFNVLVGLAMPAPEYANYCPSTEPIAGQPTTPDIYTTCQPLYQAASDQHALYAFTLMVGLGVLALIVGFVPIGSSIVSTGLSYGGVAALVIGSAEYWGNAGQWIRFAIALAGLVALLYIGWKRFRD